MFPQTGRTVDLFLSTLTSDNNDNEEHDISGIDANGQVLIKEAKSAGFKMPIKKEHWLYQYMTDGDGDGMVGE